MTEKVVNDIKDLETGMFVKLHDPYAVTREGEIDQILPTAKMLNVLDESGTRFNFYLTPDTKVTVLDKKFQPNLKNWTNVLAIQGVKAGTNGADPEVFVLGGDNQVLEAWKFLPSKARSDYYWDGFQAEFQTAVGHCLNYQTDSSRSCLFRIWAAAQKVDPKAKLTPKSTFEIPMAKLLAAKDEHVALGCAPSFNAYGLHGDVPNNPRMLTWRFAGGHIHRGWAGLNRPRADRIVKAVDAIVGIPSITMFQNLDNPVRRKFYGLPGEYRLPKHGLEYRVLSSAWLCHPAISQFTRELVRFSMGLAKAHLEQVFSFKEEDAVRIIMEHDVDAAKKFVKDRKTQYQTLLEQIWSGYKHPISQGMKLLVSPVEEFVDPDKMEQNWRFNEEWVFDCGSPNTRWVSFAAR